MQRTIGLDVGAETVKVVELRGSPGRLEWTRRARVDHQKDPAAALREVLASWGWDAATGACATGRLGRALAVERIPGKQARIAGHHLLYGNGKAAAVVDIGAHGFSVLALEADGRDTYRENPRCSQGTGNFLRQLVERFGLTPEEADAVAAGAAPAPLSGRCPVILKTDMTHLANKGEDRGRILAGLFDAICDNVQVLVKARGPREVLLAGGVARSRRVRDNFAAWLAARDMTLREGGDDALYLDALGCAAIAAERPAAPPPLDALFRAVEHAALDRLPALREALPRVRRLGRPAVAAAASTGPLILGLDVGSTGSKVVALDAATRQPVWEAYARTGGDPVGAAQGLVRRFTESAISARPVAAAAVTGSGREIVGSLMATCYGPERVHVLNEIAAHAEGARAYDPRVDTIFEIGGQDAKYIRLEGGRVVDAAMNEACSAGTGSFIEEQGRRLGGLGAAELGAEAIAADGCVALGQHCAVFMAEILDEAAAAGADRRHVVAGLYESVIQNYLNRVKGQRSVGSVVFCQGMPFSSDALAAAVARQTGAEVIVPPSPGTVGAFGIALLAREALGLGADGAPAAAPLDPARFLEARVERKEVFVCKSTQGCGGTGNLCKIDRLRTVVDGKRQAFTWGGACSLYDQGTRGKKLPDGAPDPFRARAEAIDEIVARHGAARAPGALPRLRSGGRARRVAIAEAFQLKTLFPYFAAFLRALGLDLEVVRPGEREALKRGIEAANVPFCAPMQQYHGVVQAMADTGADFVFLPMLRDLPPVKDEPHTWLCPIVQGSPDVVRHDLGKALGARVLSPVIRTGEGFLESARFLDAVRALAAQVGVASEADVARAHAAGREEQLRFERRLHAIGEEAVTRCAREGLLPVVVLGRAYTIHDDVLNSNVPALLREQGAVAIPVDCFPVDAAAPLVPGAFWSYTQRILRAAHEIRRTPGVYSIFTSNYACGPDSFTLHHYHRLMEGKPFAVIETDGHAGDAGTKTRVEAFLHCVREDLRSRASEAAPAAPIMPLAARTLPEIAALGSRVLVPPMGPEAAALHAALRGYGVDAEVLPRATVDTIRLGRRHTSGKECLPMTVTVGSLLERIEKEPGRPFTFFMPGSNGPCRFGMYRQLHQMVLARAGESGRVGIWSPPDSDYFEGVPPGMGAIVLGGLTAYGLLADAARDVRPVERTPGAANAVLERWSRRLFEAIETAAAGDLSARKVIVEAATGRIYGMRDVVAGFARELSAVRDPRPHPTVLLVGEIYVRSDPASNGWAADELERRGLRVRIEPVVEYLQYSDLVQLRRGVKKGWKAKLKTTLRRRIVERLQHVAADGMGWPRHAPIPDVVAAGAEYLRPDLEHEAVLALGLATHGWRDGTLDGVLCVGPLECMPNKLVEAQLVHAAEREGLVSLTLSLNGDPIDPEVLDQFAYEVRERFRARHGGA
ncbi:MAG TPA: acyl-CoA dehydratase activase-related protein [Anaeromyxobacter sp.]|nr:acyl-CoA dehydratase activase-related protein [Anaeromyxobacter sp.]